MLHPSDPRGLLVLTRIEREGPLRAGDVPGLVGRSRAAAARLVERFAHREKDDLQRIAAVFDLALSGQCRTRQLLRYFGEKLSAPCGHCDVCTSEALPAAAAMPICSRDLTDGERKAMHELLAERHAPLRSARQFARFLCGMASPATTRERLTRHDCFGVLADLPFRDVLAEVIALVG